MGQPFVNTVTDLDAHLRKYHAASATLRRQILECFSQFETVAPSAIELPEEPAQPIEELGNPLDGAQCETCRWITINKDEMRRHCTKKHQQAWVGKKSLLYKTVKEIEQELQTLKEAARTDETGWFKRTGWLEFFKDRNLAHLAHQARAPDHGEHKIKLAAELTEPLVERSVRGLATLPQEIRRWLRSAKQSEVDPRPLARLQNPESQTVYASYMVRFVCFFLRVLGDEEHRISRVRQRRVDSDSEEVAGSKEGSKEDSKDGENSEAESDAPRPVDRMKDARELFTFTRNRRDVLSGRGMRLTAMTGELRWRRFLRLSARSSSRRITR
ncbi:hypothetical protein BU25DRAFT_469294 [Macroventuria anomochaeta]|uniref:Uncharacterized protein n=1 Tax=Macroventuria anomochaeta TaxID=301207 RepID=A0ACB6S0R0_9PLEO|nr:uncharacterized protein BU25DRAFT_469294 [Macroventuria anomochaeta]KAF2626978.1 hypothetical protein BU25DRAFT_469294 [Macroventuria anomochaeta]